MTADRFFSSCPEGQDAFNFNFGSSEESGRNSPAEAGPLTPHPKWQKRWRLFHEAREWARSQGFKHRSEFYAARDRRPADIPGNPGMVYNGFGWAGFDDFLGMDQIFWSFEKARDWAHEQRDKGAILFAKEWARSRLDGLIPMEIPSNPDVVYKDQGWIGWDDFLGRTDRRRSKLERVIGAALAQLARVQDGHVSLVGEGGLRKKVDIFLPDIRTVIEVDGCRYHHNTLDKDTRQTQALTAAGYRVIRIREQSSEYTLPLISPELDMALPKALRIDERLHRVLEHLATLGVIPLYDRTIHATAILVTGTYWPGTWLPFEEARVIARSLGLRSRPQWEAFVKSPAFQDPQFARIPTAPRETYQGKFKGWGDFLGTGNVRGLSQFVSYEEAKRIIQPIIQAMENPPRDEDQWFAALRLVRIPECIPRAPRNWYRDEFLGFSDFLGTGWANNGRLDYLPIEEASAWVIANIPLPRTIGMFKKFVAEGRLPHNIPRTPDCVYAVRGTWIDWQRFLRTDRKKRRVPFASFEEARAWVRENLPPMRSKEDWKATIKGRRLPSHITRLPYQTYSRRNEWKGWPYFLSFEKPPKKRR